MSQKKQLAYNKISKLVESFDVNIDRIKKEEHGKEDNTILTYIVPFWEALGWSKSADNYLRRELVIQGSLKSEKSFMEPDLVLRLSSSRTKAMKDMLYIEAKHPKYDLTKEKRYIRQAYQYAHSTTARADNPDNWVWNALLTDFEEFRLFDCVDPKPMVQGNEKLLNKYIVSPFDWKYQNYISDFDILWDSFSRDQVAKGSFEQFKLTKADIIKKRKAPDDQFLDDLEKWREEIANSIWRHNHKEAFFNDRLLTSATQLILDRLIFVKMLADNNIEDDYLTLLLDQISRQRKKDISLYDSCQSIFKKLDTLYNGSMFKKRGELDAVSIGNKALQDILTELRPENSVYTLASMDVKILGSAYERFLGNTIVSDKSGVTVEEKPEVRKAGGVFYTPQYIVEYIVEHTVGELLGKCKKPEDVEKLKILDPSCGSGSFLIGVYDALLAWYEKFFAEDAKRLKKQKARTLLSPIYKNYADVSETEIDGMVVRLTAWLKKKILSDNIFGVDIDAQAVEVSRFSLSLKALENSAEHELHQDRTLFNMTILPDMSGNIKCGNSLIGSDILNQQQNLFDDMENRFRINPFDWDKEFEDIMKTGGFDAVVGNPPYVRQEGLSEFKPYFKAHYKVYHGVADLYSYFIEKGIRMLKEGGKFGYIVANKWMRANYGKPLRSFLKQQQINLIIDFGDLQVFQNATTYPCILLTTKDKPRNKFSVVQMESLKFANLTDHVKKHQYIVNQIKLEDQGWSLTDERSQELLDKLRKTGIPLAKYVDGKIYRGVLTGFNKAFVIDEETRNRLIVEDPKSEELIKPFLVGKDIKRYKEPKTKQFLILIAKGWTTKHSGNAENKWQWLMEQYPAIAKYLDHFSEQAKKRYDQGEYWWELRACSYYPEFEKVKIIFPDISLTGNFAMDTMSHYTVNTSYIIPIPDMLFLGILNSKIIKFFYSKISSTYRGGYLRWIRQYVMQLPIRPIDFKNKADCKLHDRMVTLVQTMLDKNKQLDRAVLEDEKRFLTQDITDTDRKIDLLVYELYGLTPEDIAIVEGD